MKNFASPSLKDKKFLIFGGGFSGKYFANRIRGLGCQAITSYRKNNNDKSSFYFDSNCNEMPPDNIFEGTTHVLSCIPPDKNGDDPVLTCIKKKLEKLNLDWVGYLSTTGVYGNTFGEWVTEENPANPRQERSKRRLICEQKWTQTDLPVQIFRLPGIYGPGRSTLDSIAKKTIRIIQKDHQVFSRIHVADISSAIIYLLENREKLKFHQIINIADDNPSSQLEVIQYSYKLLNLDMPKPIDFNEAKKELSPIALSFWEENRRVSNKLLCETLGYKLIYKDYKSGLKDCLQYIQQNPVL